MRSCGSVNQITRPLVIVLLQKNAVASDRTRAVKSAARAAYF
jgi:hypothetical protein